MAQSWLWGSQIVVKKKLKGLKHGLHMPIHKSFSIFSGDKMCVRLNVVFWRARFLVHF